MNPAQIDTVTVLGSNSFISGEWLSFRRTVPPPTSIGLERAARLDPSSATVATVLGEANQGIKICLCPGLSWPSVLVPT